uniref:Pectate lyase N-terminal domain-containing protein n=1 Tax=Gossypium raimondii TaxID=29730 RepID=A0A0D2V1S6_GOSRA|nr:hypothetical protein B456_009G439500 [Gossypium raimondii]
MEVTKLRVVFLFSFFTLIPKLWANIAEFDDFWKQREEEAWKIALTAYERCPENVTSHLNYHVNKVLKKTLSNQPFEFKDVITNSTRRSLRDKHKNTSPCMTINPIDRCWRCKKNSKNRKRLSKCYLVADNSDDDVVNPKPRTLRHAVIQKRPLWIIFAPDMNFKLSQELMIMVQSHKTIDSRGSNVYIAYECGITLQFVHNVVIHNIHVHRTVKSNGGLIRDSEDHYGSMHPTIISQGNRFIAPDNPLVKEITHRNYAPESEWRNWIWRAEGDLFMNGAFFCNIWATLTSPFQIQKEGYN